MNNTENNAKEKITFLKYGLASMINEYNSIEDIEKKKEYMDALTEWYMREKDTLKYAIAKTKE